MRKFKVQITYEVELSHDDDLTTLHIMDAVYRSQVGDEKGKTSVKPPLNYSVEEINMSVEEMKS